MKSSPVESYSDPPLTTGDEKLSIFHIVILSRGRQYANEDCSYLRGLSSRPPPSDTQLTLLLLLSLPLIHYSWARKGIDALYPEMLSIFPSKTVIGSVQSMAPCLGWWSQCALFGYYDHNCCCALFKSGDRCTLRNLIGIALFECCIAFLRSAWGRRSHTK